MTAIVGKSDGDGPPLLLSYGTSLSPRRLTGDLHAQNGALCLIIYSCCASERPRSTDRQVEMSISLTQSLSLLVSSSEVHCTSRFRASTSKQVNKFLNGPVLNAKAF